MTQELGVASKIPRLPSLPAKLPWLSRRLQKRYNALRESYNSSLDAWLAGDARQRDRLPDAFLAAAKTYERICRTPRLFGRADLTTQTPGSISEGRMFWKAALFLEDRRLEQKQQRAAATLETRSAGPHLLPQQRPSALQERIAKAAALRQETPVPRTREGSPPRSPETTALGVTKQRPRGLS